MVGLKGDYTSLVYVMGLKGDCLCGGPERLSLVYVVGLKGNYASLVYVVGLKGDYASLVYVKVIMQHMY